MLRFSFKAVLQEWVCNGFLNMGDSI